MLHPAWQALVVALTEPSLRGLRLSSALLGALTVPALWMLARALFDRPTALAAAVVLAGFAPHVHFSRIGLPHVADALFGTLALAGIAGGLAGAGRSAWAVGGVALGLTHYGFEAGRWFFTPLVIVWLVTLAVLAPARLRGAGAGVATLAAACALTSRRSTARWSAPAVRRHRACATRRSPPARRRRCWQIPPALGARLVRAAGAYVGEPEAPSTTTAVTIRLLTPLLAPFAILGVALSAWRPRAPAVLIPLWVLAAWLANVAMRDPLIFPRWVVVLPGLALAAGRGVCAVTGWVCGAPRARRAALGDRRARRGVGDRAAPPLLRHPRRAARRAGARRQAVPRQRLMPCCAWRRCCRAGRWW